jgi:hypothetical protein
MVKLLGQKSKTGRFLPNVCFAAILGIPQNGRCQGGFLRTFVMVCLLKTKQRYIFLLTHLQDSSYLLHQPVYLGVCAFDLKRTLVKF